MSVTGRPLPVRLYGALLALLPADLRHPYAADAEEVFLDQYRDVRAHRGRLGAARLWARSAAALLACALRARRQDARHVRGRRGAMTGGAVQEIRVALRTLRKRPSFAATAILVLGVGIGATTTIFSVVDTVVIRELPYPAADRLVHFGNGAHSFPSFSAWQGLSSLESVAAAWDRQVDLTGEGAPERLPSAAVSLDFFRLLGAAPYLGRLFDAGDYPGDGSRVVLAYGAWQRRWGADPDIVGRTLQVDGSAVDVIGILAPDVKPPSIETGSRVDLWFALGDGGESAEEHGFRVLGILGRLRPGSSLAVAQAEIDAQRRTIAEKLPRFYVRRDGTVQLVPLTPLREATVQGVSATLYLLLGAVALMLLIACANVANLFLARGTTRAREIALRSALGAARSRLMAMVLSESLTLSLLGGALGVAITFVGVELFTRFNPGGIPRIEDLAVDRRILAFSLLVSVATGVLFGTLPALRASSAPVNQALKEGAASATTGRRGRRTRNTLVVAEISLAVVLVVAAGLLFRTLGAMVGVDPGFRTTSLATLRVSADATYEGPDRVRFTQALLEQVEALPGVRAVAAGWTTPFRYTGRSRCCWSTSVVGNPAFASDEEPFLSIVHPVTPGYFATLGAPLSYGRDFERGDMSDDGRVAILNRGAAAALFGVDDAVGRTITLGDEETLTVVGVARGVHHWGLSEPVEPTVYVPYGRYGGEVPDVDLIVRADTPFEALAPALREAVWRVDPDLPIEEIGTMDGRIRSSVASPRFLSLLFGAFASLALILASAGVYGSMLYTVGQRRKEMGIRLALGADGGAVLRLVLRYGATLAVVGLGIGFAGAWVMSRLLRSLVWGVEPTDPVSFAAAAMVLGGSSLLASFLPAWKASRTDPLETLRTE